MEDGLQARIKQRRWWFQWCLQMQMMWWAWCCCIKYRCNKSVRNIHHIMLHSWTNVSRAPRCANMYPPVAKARGPSFFFSDNCLLLKQIIITVHFWQWSFEWELFQMNWTSIISQKTLNVRCPGVRQCALKLDWWQMLRHKRWASVLPVQNNKISQYELK